MGDRWASWSLLLEKFVEGFANVIALDGLSAAARSQRNTFVRLEVIAEIRLQLVFDIIGLRFGALVVSARIEEPAVFATMQVGVTVGTFIPALDFAYDFDLSPTVVTNHNAPRERLINGTGFHPVHGKLSYQKARR